MRALVVFVPATHVPARSVHVREHARCEQLLQLRQERAPALLAAARTQPCSARHRDRIFSRAASSHGDQLSVFDDAPSPKWKVLAANRPAAHSTFDDKCEPTVTSAASVRPASDAASFGGCGGCADGEGADMPSLEVSGRGCMAACSIDDYADARLTVTSLFFVLARCGSLYRLDLLAF